MKNAFLEESLCRVLLMPDPTSWIPEWRWWNWSAGSRHSLH
ncbi:hypothetical protein [Leptolyngbya sp. O-77]|nr:hypothetical protein [Leptolyngbya sp. O-77]